MLTSGNLVKTPGDRRWCHFDFGDLDELIAGETITGTPSVTATPTGLTIDSVAIISYSVGFWLGGGTLNSSYTLTCTISTSGGATLSRSTTVVVTQ